MIRYPTINRLKYSGAIFLLFIVLIVPVTASFVFQDISVSPEPPLIPGQMVSVSSQLIIIPQGGSTTFIRNNELQLTTQLKDARWNVDVLVNGIPAAQMPVNGNTVFINGFLLSYPVSSDVSVSVKVNGTDPGTAGPDLNVIQAVQLNNAGQAVPGSLQSISEPLMVQAPSLPATTVASPSSGQTTVIPTKTPGFSTAAGAGSLVICCILLRVSGGIRKT